MKLTHTVMPAALLAILVLTPTSVLAQHRSGGGGSHRGGGGQGSQRGVAVPRGGDRGGPRTGGPYGGGSGYRGYYPYYRSSYYRPYYSFRPRLNLGFGLWAGYSVGYPYGYFSYGYGYPYRYYSYPYAYGYPYGYAYPYPNQYAYPYSYPPQGPTTYAYPPSTQGYSSARVAASGGVSFEITPESAEVYVDGRYAGTVGEFSPSSEPLMISPGRHRVEVRAPNYETMAFDTDVLSGQVIPYQGTMQPR